MLWLERVEAEEVLVSNTIIVAFEDGMWQSFKDTWTEEQPESDSGTTAPEGLYQPVRGFGKLWRENPELQEQLGWGLAREWGYTAAWQAQIVEPFPNMVYVSTLDDRVLRLDGWGMGSGAWEYVIP
jgi:hypothetical protein